MPDSDEIDELSALLAVSRSALLELEERIAALETAADVAEQTVAGLRSAVEASDLRADEAENTAARERHRADRAESERLQVLASSSWHVTAPLRWIRDKFRGISDH